MKRTKVLALVLAAAVMLMGAGYAAWTDSFAVTNTVTTSELDMQIDDAYFYDGDNLGEPQRAWTEATIVDWDENSLIVTASDLYPGADVRLDIYASNHSNVPVKFDSANVEFIEGDWALFNELTARGGIAYDTDGPGTKFATVSQSFGYNQNPAHNKLTNLNANLQPALANMVLHENGTLYFDDTNDHCIRFGLPMTSGNEFQNKSCKFKITFNFGQPTPAAGLPIPTTTP
jgi:hypothetical protein